MARERRDNDEAIEYGDPQWARSGCVAGSASARSTTERDIGGLEMPIRLCDPLPSLPWTPPSIPACSDVPDRIRLTVCRNWTRSFILNPSRPKRSSAYYGPAGNCKGCLRISVHVCGCLVPGDLGERQDLVQPAQPGHRIIYLKVDADTGDDVPNDDIVMGPNSTRVSSSRSPMRSSRISRWNPRGPSRSISSTAGPTSTRAT
ncbi:hypothetical protein ABIC08_008972 [Bradyrhizobium sp. RT9b]